MSGRRRDVSLACLAPPPGSMWVETTLHEAAGAAGAIERPGELWAGRFLTGLGSALDAAVMRVVQIVVEHALIPGSRDLHALRDSAKSALSPELQSEPRRFFGFLDDPSHALQVKRRVRRRMPGGIVMACRIQSDYRPYHPEIPPSKGPILLEHWVHDTRRPRGTVLALHGFGMGQPRIDAAVLFASHWFRRGLDVALLTMPHHGARSPAGVQIPGGPFALPHVARLGEAMRETIFEIRRLTHWLRQESDRPVGVIGISLGGYLAALSAALCEDLDFVVPIAPPVCIGDLAWRVLTRTRHYRQGRATALSEEELRNAFRVHSPLAHPLRVAKERVLIVAGRGDRIVPPEHPRALWRHWGEPGIHWFSGGHLTPFGRGRIAGAILRHLESIDIA